MTDAEELELLELEAEAAGNKVPTEAPSVSPEESAVRGFARGATLGFAPKITAAYESATGPKTYEESLKETLPLYEAAQKANPKIYGASELGGGVASAFLPGIGAAKGVGLLARIARATGQGAIAGYGYSNAKSDEDKLKDIGYGGAAGLVGGAAGEALGAAGSKLKDTAEKLYVSHLRPTPKVAYNLGPEKLKEIGRAARDSGGINFWNKAQDSAEKLAELSNEAGAAKEALIKNAGVQIDPKEIAGRIQEEVVNPLMQTTAGEPLAEKIQGGFLKRFVNKHIPDVGPQTMLSLPQSEAEKTAVQGLVNYTPGGNGSLENDNLQKLARIFREAGDTAAEKEGIPGFQAAKKLYGNLESAQQMAERTGALHGGGLKSHLVDLVAGGEGLNLLTDKDKKNKELGALLLLGRLATRGRGAAMGGVTVDTLSKLLSNKAVQSGVSGAVRTGGRNAPKSIWENLLKDENK